MLVVFFHEDITQQDLKNASPWYTCHKSLHKVPAMLVHYFWRYEHFSRDHFYISRSDFVACSRKLWTTQIPCKNDNYSYYSVHRTQSDQLEPNVLMQKLSLKNFHRFLRYWQKCFWVVQRFLLQATKSDHKKIKRALRKRDRLDDSWLALQIHLFNPYIFWTSHRYSLDTFKTT